MRVFISSVMTPAISGRQRFYELGGERETAVRQVEAMGFEAVAFERLPSATESARETYRRELHDSDAAVFLVWQRMTESVVDEYREASRLGIPRLVFVKECREGEARSAALQAFLTEVVNPDAGITYSRFDTTQQLGDLLRQSIARYVTESIRSCTYQPPISANLYAAAAVIVASSRQRLALCQRSPSYILPVKSTGDPDRDSSEDRLCGALAEWIERVRKNTPCRLLLLGAIDQTLSEFRRLSSVERKGVLERLADLQGLEAEFPETIRLGWVESYKQDMYVASAGDRRYGLYVANPLTGDPVALLVGANRELADAIFAFVEKIVLSSSGRTKELIDLLTKAR